MALRGPAGISAAPWGMYSDDACGIYIGGGFPEEFAQQLADQTAVLDSSDRELNGIPVFAECGGFMFLTRFI